jgi:hypothetical protein
VRSERTGSTDRPGGAFYREPHDALHEAGSRPPDGATPDIRPFPDRGDEPKLVAGIVAERTLEPSVSSRPISLVIAVAFVALIAAGISIVGVLFLAVAAGAIPFLAQSSMSPIVALLGGIAIALGGLTFAAAVGLWRRRAWGWMGSLVVGIGSVIGAVIAIETSGPQVPALIGLGIAVATIALVLAPPTQVASGVVSEA